MEYCGKILCISKNDLTRDDRPDDKPENAHLAPVMSVECYKALRKRKKVVAVQKGVGRGVNALISVESLPDQYKEKAMKKYGNINNEALRNWFNRHWAIDEAAQVWFSRYRIEGQPLKPELQQEYVINASTLQSAIDLMNSVKMRRAAMKGADVNWKDMVSAISFYQKEFGHTLPTSVNRFRRCVKEFKEKGYESLISGKVRNQNRRKVNIKVEQVVLGLATHPNRPFNTNVADMYNQFVKGELTAYDPTTGEIFNPTDFLDKNGNPLELSQATINKILNQPKNQTLIKNKLMSWSTYMHAERPHVHRHLPEYSFSKITMDDRDLPRKDETKQRPKVYYAYDVTSGCVVGFSYKREKNVDLVLDCFRSMFRLIASRGWGCPAMVEVENHLMTQFKEGFLKAGEVFKHVRFCAPLNSQEKHAEQFNGAKKRSIEHKNRTGVGRFYAKDWRYQTESKKISDETNELYEDKKYYCWDELVADDMMDVLEWNNSLHSNQKKYPGMTRWDVLEQCMNPNLEPLDEALLAKYIGYRVNTSIRRNSYCRVNYTDLWLSGPDILDKLAPNNREVEAYYLTKESGEMGNVYIYQGDTYIDTLVNKGTFNEAESEQTAEDLRIMTEQNKYISQFDAKIKKEAIAPVAVMKAETAKKISQSTAKQVNIPKKAENASAEMLIASVGSYKGLGTKSV